MSDAVPITAIVISGVVGPATAAGLTLYQAARHRRAAREDELLKVLDDVVLELGKPREALEAMFILWRDGVPPRRLSRGSASAGTERPYQHLERQLTAA
jgi:hypothetical protein